MNSATLRARLGNFQRRLVRGMRVSHRQHFDRRKLVPGILGRRHPAAGLSTALDTVEAHMRRMVALATIQAAVCVGCPAFAADLPKQGSYDFMSCYSGTVNAMDFSPTHMANTSEVRGTVMSNPPGGLFDKVSFRCLTMSYAADGKPSGMTLCEGVDKDGDKYLSHLVVDGGQSTRKVVAGTGKYAGMTASGTTVTVGPFGKAVSGQVQNCTHQTGTYTLK